MVDPGESGIEAAVREFGEEAGNNLDKYVSDSIEIYTGYVDDPRNTDNSWMETACYHIHLGDASLDLVAGDDAGKAKWTEYSDTLVLYASHKQFIDKAIDLHKIATDNSINDVEKRNRLLEFNEPITVTLTDRYHDNNPKIYWDLVNSNKISYNSPLQNLKNRNELSYISVDSGNVKFSRSLKKRSRRRRRSRNRRSRRKSQRRKVSQRRSRRGSRRRKATK